MASLLVSSSVAEIFTPSLSLQREEKKRNTETEIRTRTDLAELLHRALEHLNHAAAQTLRYYAWKQHRGRASLADSNNSLNSRTIRASSSPAAYLNLSTVTPDAIPAAVCGCGCGQAGWMPYIVARRLAALNTNSACSGSAGLKSRGVGGFLAPDLRGGNSHNEGYQ
jgi:hypothetical protein